MSASPHPSATAPRSAALRAFEAQWLARGVRGSDPLSGLREQAMQQVLRLGLPTTRDETWRYTNLRHLGSQGFVDAPERPAGAVEAAAALSLLSADERAATVLMVNGHPVVPKTLGANFNNLEIKSLRDLSRTNPELITRHLEPLSEADQTRWTALNTALFLDGLYLHVSGAIAAPLVIVHVMTSAGRDNIAFPRVIIDCAPGSTATIVEHYVEWGEAPPLCNSATHIAVARDARIEHYRVFATGTAAEHLDSLNIRQDANSYCKQFTIALGGSLVRTSAEAALNQPGASLDSYSLLVGHDARHVDCVNIVTHAARETTSKQTARAIASGTSRVIFNTKVVVDAGAEHAHSQQSCRGLLLSPQAEIDTRPQLEIHADEVKCAHGATIGRLNPDMLFYMLSRGLDRATAQSLLVYAFLADVLTDMSLPAARSAIEDSLIAQLPDSQLLDEFR